MISIKRAVEVAALTATLFVAVSLLALPLWLDVVVVSVVAIALGWQRSAMLVTSFMVVVMAVIVSQVAWVNRKELGFNGPHEKYTKGDIYEKKVHDVVSMPHGDLYAIDAGQDSRRESTKEPRSVEFITDEWGLRNTVSALGDADLVLVGDSFIVASSTTQSSTPANVLAQLTNSKVASIAYPGAPKDYENRVREHIAHLKNSAALYVFYFEGNDFFVPQEANAAWNQKLMAFVRNAYWRLESLKDWFLSKTYSESQRFFFRSIRAKGNLITLKLTEATTEATATSGATLQNRVQYFEVGGKPVAFLKSYIDMASANNLNTYIFKDDEIIQRTRAVFFVPTKYRVFSGQLNVKLQDSTYQQLKASYVGRKIPVYDLTPALQKEAARRLPNGQYVYWRDDTHWNAIGIKAAMKCVAYSLV